MFICRIHPQKRPFLMLHIVEELKKNIEDIAVIVVGDGPQLEELQNEVVNKKLEETIYFAGRQSSLEPYYKDSDITLICSLKEGLALTAYESLSMGVPVVSADVGGQAELIDDSVGRIIPLLQNEADALDCRKFSKEEIQLYVDAIKTILKDKGNYKIISKNCRERIEKYFSSNIMIQKLEKEFENLMSPEHLEKRKEISKALKMVSSMIDDYVTLYNEYENTEKKCEEIWKAKLWFEEHAVETHDDNCEYISKNTTDAQKQLEEIYNMRTWKLVQKYRNFMDNTWVGKTIRKLIKKI